MKNKLKQILMVLAGVVLAGVTFAGDGGLNPQFVKWRKMKAAGFLPEQRRQAEANATLTPARGGGTMVGGKLWDLFVGLAPDIASLQYLADFQHLVGSRFKTQGGYPTSFDLREEGCATAARTQGNFESCWAFASYGSLESSVLVQKPEGQTYTASDIDFSERHMVDNHGYDLTPMNGGSMLMSMAYLLRWGGPVSESVCPYPEAGATTWPQATGANDGPRLHVQQVRWIPGKTTYLDNDTIKDTVMNYGGIYATLYMDAGSYYKGENAAYYCPASKTPNHGVVIIGWDDNYSKANFASKPYGNGAYLAKNSWGTSWGDQGCFWISYYDANCAVSSMAAFGGNESKANYASIYQYDELGYTGLSHSGNSRNGKAWMANVFTATNDDQIAAVGFYVLAPKTQYSIRVYTGCTGAPNTGDQSSQQNGTVDYAGYVTIPLDHVVSVDKDTTFAVCAQLYSPGFPYKDSDGVTHGPLAYESPVAGYSTRASASKAQSYFSANGTKWYDLADKVKGANFCVKAYGIGDEDEADHKDKARPKELLVEGLKVIAAGLRSVFKATLLFDDNSRFDQFELEYEIVSGGEALSSDEIEVNGNELSLKVRDDLAEDTPVVVLMTGYDDISGEYVEKEIVVTATKATPSAPTDITATGGETAVESGVRLSWTAVDNASSYAIYRGETGDSKNATYLETIEGNKYTDLTAVPGTDYTYFIKSQNKSGTSDFSAGAAGWRKLAAPSDFTASDGDYDYVQLTWQAVEGARYYRVIRDTDMDAEGNPTANAEILTNTVDGIAWMDKLAFQDTPPEKGTNYIYWVQSSLSFTGYRPSAWSIFDIGSRAAPVTLSSVQINGAANVSDGETATYTLTASLSNGLRIDPVTNAVWSCSLGGEPVTDGSYAFTPEFDDGTVSSNVLVTISASWTYENEDGSWTKADAKGVVIVPLVPAKPNAVKVAAATTDGITLSWNAVTGASAYRLYRGESQETAQLLQTTTELGYLDAKAMPGVSYRYWIEAVNVSGSSVWSDASAVAMRQFTSPIYVTASNGTSTEDVTVSWRAVTGAKRYRVSRADSVDGTPHALSGWIENRTYQDTTATPGETYWYFVQAAYDENGGSASAYSAATIGKVSPAQTLAFVEIDGPSSIQYDSQGSFVCTATYANGVTKRVNPTWSFKSANPLVTVNDAGIVTAGHVTGSDLHLELQASYTDNGITKTDSFAITIVAYVEEQPTVFVSNVVVRARWPWNGLVDISYDLYSSPATARAVVTVSGYDHDLNRTLQATTLSGDGIDYPAAGGAPHKDCRVTWNLGADYENFHASAFSVALGAAAYAVAAPADFRASDNTSTNGVELAWEAAFGAEYYEIYRQRTDGTDEKVLIASVTNLTEFLDTTAAYSENYNYWIKTVAGEFESDVSAEADPVQGKRLKPPSIKPSVDLQNGLVAYYPFNGNLDDMSGNSNHIVIVTGDDPAAEARSASAGSAYAFAGKTRLNVTTNNPSVLADTFTFSAWVKTSALGTLRAEQKVGFNTGCNFVIHPSHATASDTAAYGLSVDANGINLFEYGGEYLPAVVRYPASLDSDWHFVCFTVEENGAPVLYVDGIYAKTGISTGRAKQLYVGELLAGGEFGNFTGALDDVCYYDRALDAEEVAALYEAGSPLVDGKPVSTEPTVDVAYANGSATVTITCVEPGADADVQPKVYYSILRTDDGETVDAREYTVPFAVEGNATVIAWSVKDGYYDSPRRKVVIKAAWKETAHETLASADTENKIDFATSGDSDWVFDPNNTSDNVEGSMKSGTIGGNGISSMSATVTGEGQFAFDWKVSSEFEFDYLEVTVDGETTHKISGEVDWAELVLELTNSATHVITWNYTKDASVDRGSDCGWVDHITWAPLGSAVDMPVATMTPLGEGAENGASNQVELACANVTGATIEYRVDLFGEEGEWQTYEGPFVIEGEATVYARAKKSGYIDSFTSKTDVKRPWLIRVGEALLMDPVTKDAITLMADYYEYGIDEEFWWDQDRTVVSDGTCASVKSPTLGDGPADDPAGIGASIFAMVNGPGTLYFDWKVDSEAGWDVLTYYAGENEDDYAYAEAISGDKDWDRIKLVFTANADHVIEWEYNKDDRGKSGRDSGWVDFLKWIPARFAPSVPDPKTGYIFGGWTTNENGAVVYNAGDQMDAEDLNETFIPVWSPITYKVVYDAQTVDDASTEQVFSYDEAQNLFAATNFVFTRGYVFAGWTTNAEDGVMFANEASVRNLSAEQDAEVRLRPVLTPIAYTVKFLEGEVVAADDIAATYDVDVTFPTLAEREGYRFDGWALSPTGEVAYAAGATAKNLAFEDGKALTYYAIWTQLADPIAQAMDAPGLAFETSGDTNWFVQAETVEVGASAMQSGKVGGNQSTTLSTVYVATNRTRVSFWWKVSSEPKWDVFKFVVNDTTKATISGLDGDWQQCSTVVKAGTNTLQWVYSKDDTGDRGDDCGWVDGLAFEAAVVTATTNAIHVAKTGNDETGDGSETNPFLTVQRGVDQAENGMTVLVHPGTYEENVEISTAIKLIATDGPLVTTIKGSTGSSVVKAEAGCNGMMIRGFTLTGGDGNREGWNVYGGAVCLRSDAVVQDCIMYGNGSASTTFAGAVRAADGANVTLENCLMYNNSSWANGGATLVEGNATLVCSHCTAAANSGGATGGFSVSNTGKLIVTNCISWANGGNQVGAYGSYYGADSTLSVGMSCVQNGASAGGAGHFTDLGDNFTTDPEFFEYTDTASGVTVPYQSNLRKTQDVGFSLSSIKKYNAEESIVEEEEEDPVVEPTAEPVFKVIQYCINKQPYTVDDAVAATNTPSIWKHDPVTETYTQIAFRDNAQGTRQNFQSSAVQWPATIQDGYKSDYFAVQITGTVNVPEAGNWTFCVGSDDGYRMILTDEDGKEYTMEYYRDRSYANDIKTFNLTKAGKYKVYIIYFEYVSTSILEVSCAKGSQWWFSSSKFKLLGTPESGITLVGGNN